MTILDRFLDLLNGLPDLLLYLSLGVSAFVENVFPPIPGDTITAFGAFLVGTGRLGLAGVFAVTTAGSLLGFMTLFGLGKALGRRFFLDKDYRFFKAEDILKAEAWFRKYGYLLVLLNRFFPGVRSVISVAGGISRLRAWKVGLLALASCGVWNLLWISLGYSLGSNWDVVRGRLGAILARYNAVVLSAGAAVALFLLIRALRRRRSSGRGS
ncbi:MAG: DedA family protein [Deltaproteobacteria bacterium]|nr:DedA family protein [Deltaproteobacteria bacterium]